jgi:HlyD family secretion protein
VFLWRLDERGNPAPIPVRAGLTDGQFTEIEGPGLEVGMEVIAAVTGSDGAGGATNPFQSGQQRPGGPGGFPTRP